MNRRPFHTRGEDGATLLFVIGFMVLVGLVSAGLATQLASSSKTRVALDQARNREYAADAAIVADIAQVRVNMTPPNTQAMAPCPTTKLTQTLNGVPIQVDCSFSLFSFSGTVLRNATFTAKCGSGSASCPAGATIIDARVHYESQSPPTGTSITVDKMYMQTWSVDS